MLRSAIIAFVFTSIAVAPIGRQPQAIDRPLKLLYAERAPYHVTQGNGVVGGLVSGPVRKALTRAGIITQWRAVPGKRQIETIRKNQEPVCSPGWFKKPEREAFAKFSDPIYQDRPQVVIIRQADHADFKAKKLTDLFDNKKLIFGVKLGYSYGTYVDQQIATLSPPVQRTPRNVSGMVRMMLGRRFDYMLAAPKEFDAVADGHGIVAVEMTDIPSGNKRYLMCSKSISNDLITRFNEALKAVIQ